MSEDIQVGPITLRFLLDKDGTGGSVDLFEMTVPPDGRMPIAHFHRGWDEVVHGLQGTLTVIIEGRPQEVGPGQTVFIKRGAVHNFENRSGAEVRCLSVLAPGQGPGYFRELASLVAGGESSEGRVRETMLKHGLIPS